jgi:acyl transferase domain-containing protein/NAD(P)-dependent dehydrogenase (short-subunit alcohol dehydrogenase family)/acyl carrier protein
VSLPTYPFARERHWIESVPRSEEKPELLPAARSVQPLAAVREVEEYLLRLYAEVSGIAQKNLDSHLPMENYGLSSLLVTRLNASLERDFGALPRTLFYEHRTLAEIAERLSSQPRKARCSTTDRRPDGLTERQAMAVAIVGIAGRYPQARDLNQFWANLISGRDCITALPDERRQEGWPVELMWGGYLDEVDRFDSLLFNIPPREADLMSPQERLFLEVVWEALDDAGYPRRRLRERHASRVGVFAGAMYNEYPFFGVEQSLLGKPVSAGAGLADIANRVSYFFDLRGPSMTVDTLCSSSLTCIHLAVESLRRGECDAAIAGGVNLSLHPNKFVEQARHQMPSSDHRCRSFGAGGDGFVPGEGVGAVLLKPLHVALADGDRIHAVIRSSAVNHGGRTSGYMVPNPSAQGEMICEALDAARIPATSIGYVEAHGTGTDLGDPIEINGLERAFAGEKPATGYWPVGSVKSSIGHLEGAAGIASLTKVVLQLKYKLLAPSLHAEHLNLNVDWEHSPFQVQRQLAQWHALRDERGRPMPRRAAVSSFGAGGANAHVIVEQYECAQVEWSADGSMQLTHLIVLSARDEERLRVVSGTLAAFLGQQPLPLSDIAYTLSIGREHLRERLALVVSNLAELREELNRFHAGDESNAIRGRSLAGEHINTSSTNASELKEQTDLADIGRKWVNGGVVDWSRLYGSQPRNIVSLPSYPFARRRHWVPWQMNQSEVTQASSVPVYQKFWEPVDDKPLRHVTEGKVLCLYHEGSEAVARQLADEIGPDRTILLREGSSHEDAIAAYANEASAQSAISLILARFRFIDTCVDLCDLYRREDDPGPWLARLHILQRLLDSQTGARVRLLHVTHGLQDLHGPPPSSAGARVAGLIRMLRSENRRVAATTMDTDICGDMALEAARQIALELSFAGPNEICYRDGCRYRRQLRSVTLPEKVLRLDPQKIYLITGGTRGLGSLVARHFLKRGARRFALMGLRTVLTRDHWDDPDLPDHAIETIRTVRELESAGAKVEIYGGVLTDRIKVETFLARARALGEIGGIVHCAGRISSDRRPFIHRDLAELRSVFEPKVEGLELLAKLCSHDRLSFFLLFSSVAGAFPTLGAGVADYAAANAFMDLFANCEARKDRHWFRSVAWPSWRDVRMSTIESPTYTNLGLDGLEIEQGLRLLDAILCSHSEGNLVVCPGRGPETDPSSLLDVIEETKTSEFSTVAPAPDGNVSVPPWLVKLFAEGLGMSESELDPELPFSDLGLESVILAELLQKIERRAGRPLEPAMLVEHPTLASLSKELAALGVRTPPASLTHTSERSMSDRVFYKSASAENRIAVIGMSCRFPGASSPAEFWANLREGRCSITEVPASRWDSGSLYRPHFEVGKSLSKWGGFVEGIEYFDPSSFNMSDEEATCLDPAIRLMLEGVETCLAEAGYTRAEVAGRDIGVFVGARASDYWRRTSPRSGSAGFGSDQNFTAARVAHHLNLMGPSLVVDSACSSSLVSIQLAVRSLLAGESELALAGGVDVLLDERPYVEFSAARALSPTGRCYVFDERADGFVPGEGCGVLLLKPLDRALRDGDKIHAVIESVTVNNDGRTVGLTTPNPAAQTAVIRRALEQSGLRAEDIAMVEAHGTGTMLGDPIELRALTDAYGIHLNKTGIYAIGSVKSNLGHLLSAAGIAGLLKVILSLEHGEIPPTLFCERPNPRFDFERSPFYVNTELRPWPTDRRLRAAGVSAFGLGGTNAHLLATALDPKVRGEFPQVRSALPPPIFKRRRLWLERDQVTRDEELVASILDLEFVVEKHGPM